MFSRKIFFCVFSLHALFGTLYSQGTWVQKASLPAAPRLASFVAFEINNKGYLGTGHDLSGNYYDDFWEYNPTSNTWTQKANFGGGQITFAIGFSIGNKGYGGISAYSSTNEFWEYDPVTNFWIQKANMPGTLRSNACAFSLAGKGYVCTGYDFTAGNSLQDSWEYNPSTNTWTQKVNLPALSRNDVDRAPFIIGNKAYIGTGFNYNSVSFTFISLNDFFEYDPGTNSWTQKANFPGMPRFGATGFSICGMGFLGLGADMDSMFNITIFNDFWMYNPTTNTWSTITAFPNGGRADAVAWVLNGKAYLGTGSDGMSIDYKDLWEFTPAGVLGGPPPALAISGNTTICIGDSAHLTATANNSYSYAWSTGEVTSSITVSPSSTTTYSLFVSSGCNSATANVTVSVVQNSIASFTSLYEPCENKCVEFFDKSFNAGSWYWSFGDGETGNNNNMCHYFNGSGTYTVTLIINNSTTCADTVIIPVLYEEKNVSTDIYIPNAFSPNGDGSNDVLNFQIKDDFCIKEFEITIYDRWGEKVFSATGGPATGWETLNWDGSFNGKKLDSQALAYYCKTITTTGSQIIRKGNISLIR